MSTKQLLIKDLNMFVTNSEMSYNEDKTVNRLKYLSLITRTDHLNSNDFTSEENFKIFSTKYQNKIEKSEIEKLFKEDKIENPFIYIKLINYILWLIDWVKLK